MTIHVVIPVFNRLAQTKALVECLRQQRLKATLRLLIVDDGSSDGTDQWLATQPDIQVLQGDGTLFWGGAVNLALRHLEQLGDSNDWVLLMNNDTTVQEDFVQFLFDAAQKHSPAVIGSVIRDEADHGRLLSIGARVDAWRLLTSDLLGNDVSGTERSDIVAVDALSGRGVLFPMASILASGGMRPQFLPHYLADYELSARVRKSGWNLFVLRTAAVYSSDDYGSTARAVSWREKLFSLRSPLYLPALLVFWWEASTWLQRLTLPVRLPLLILFPRLRKSSR